MPELVTLIREHAEYERAAPPNAELPVRLLDVLFARNPRLHALVVETADGIVGYSTYSLQYETWKGEPYMDMDCLYLQASARGSGLGGRLMSELQLIARRLGVREIRWQTPDWNDGAIRFYDRLGARRSTKERYVLGL